MMTLTSGPIIQLRSHLIFCAVLLLRISARDVAVSGWTNGVNNKADIDSGRLPGSSSSDRPFHLDRRTVAQHLIATATGFAQQQLALADVPSTTNNLLRVVRDPNTYSALIYSPSTKEPPPLIVVLHGAGRNDLDIVQDLADPIGEHAGLIPSLIASGKAPKELLDNFAILAPYSQGKTSFYSESRSKLLNFIQWAASIDDFTFDPLRVFLFGFSDGATVAVELMTTRRFAGAIICSYGYTGGALPERALEGLAGLPIWVFHSADDVIFNVQNSDRLVQQLQTKNNNVTSSIRYNRYQQDPEHLPPRVRGHSMGITASKLPQVYRWLLELPPLELY